jgi:hypothetical protein
MLMSLVLVGDSLASPVSADVRAEFAQALTDFDEAQRLQGSQPDRARQLFRSAAQRFEAIVGSGVVSGPLEFNLGNCHLQAGDVGRAILHYRRAERLTPDDPLLAENLSVARSRCLTTIRPAGRAEVLETIFFWHYQSSVESRKKLVVALYVAFWAVLAARSFSPRRWLLVTSIVLAAVTVSLGTSVAATHWSDRNAPAGVITGVDVPVRKGPGESYQRQFEQPLQPGVEFVLSERRGSWWNVQLADGNSGWVRAIDAELVREERPTGVHVLKH